MIAALQGDLDTSDGVGKVFFRQDSSREVLRQAAEHINRAFPEDDEVEPTHAVVVTWVDVASHEPQPTGDEKVSITPLLEGSVVKVVVDDFSNYIIMYYSEKHLPAGDCILRDGLLCNCPLHTGWDSVFLHAGTRQ